MLVRVDMRHRDAGAHHPVQLGVQLTTHVVGIDPSGETASDDRAVAQRKRPSRVHQRGDLPTGQQRRVLADEGQVRTQLEARQVAEDGHRIVELAADGEQRGGGHDALLVPTPHCSVHAAGQSQVVRRHDEQTRHERCPEPVTGARCRSSPRSSAISLSMARMTPREESVETPRVRGK